MTKDDAEVSSLSSLMDCSDFFIADSDTCTMRGRHITIHTCTLSLRIS
ncbi:F18O14.28 [Arabidopsis thaliana]|uniref:F18O14.28 n=1 Tax=Arabidopsis thaliana TaxID=3702 RepID=Q9LN42_ARATH|nr:F18O14.28 [Arabidopsis thaliana]